MILLRSLLYFAAMVLTGLIYGLFIAVVGPFRPTAFTDRWSSRWGRLNLRLQALICGLRYQIKGTANLPDGPFIVMAKHQSTWETIGLRGILPPHQSWVLKKELMKIPVFGTGLRLAHSIPIDRSAGRRAVLKVVEEGMKRLAENRIVIIFPEGTRTAPGQHRKYGLGGAILAERSGATVIPIAHNAGVFWRRRGVKKYPGTIEVVIGPPIVSEGRKAAEIIREVENWIEAKQPELSLERPNT